MMNENSTSIKVQRTTSDDVLYNEKTVGFLINDYYIVYVTINKNQKKDTWTISDIRKKHNRVRVTGNIRESSASRERFIKDIINAKIIEKDILNTILLNISSRIDNIIKEYNIFDEQKETEEDEYSSSVVFNDKLYEEVYKKTGEVCFVTLNDGIPIYKDSINGIYPLVNKAIKEHAVLLPSEPIGYGNVKELIKNIRAHIQKYVDIPEEYCDISTYYILMSWLYENLSVLPYLRALGDSGTGKSRLIDTIGRLLYKPCVISGAVTPAPIYRLINQWKGSLIIDEGDFKESGETNEVITILNCGFEKGRPIIRCDKDDPNELMFFNSFGPKIIGTRKPFKDYALESRCITHLTKKTTRKDIPRVIGKTFHKEQSILRNKLLMFRLRYFLKINTDIEIDFNFNDIDPRIEQVMRGFFVIFKNIPGMDKKFEEFVIKYNNDIVEQRAESMEGWIVNTIVDLIVSGERKDIKITTTDVTDEMNKNITDEKRKKRASTIGKYLRTLGIITKSIKVEGKTKRLLVFDNNFLEVVKSYVPRDDFYYDKVKRLREVTAVTAVSLSVVKKKMIDSPLYNYTSDDKNEDKNVLLVADSQYDVTAVTNVTKKLKKWKNDGKNDVGINFLEMYDITEDDIKYLLEKGLIHEISPGVFRYL